MSGTTRTKCHRLGVPTVTPTQSGSPAGIKLSEADVALSLEARVDMTEDPPSAKTVEDRVPAELKRRFCSGDLDALGEIYNVYSGPVHAVTRGILGSGGQTDDAVQEAFMRAWRGASSFDPDRALAPWLFTIARRTAIDAVRREARPTRSNHDELTENYSIDLPGIEEAWERWEIRVALEQLPEEERAVLFLSHYHGMTHPQIAEHLQVPAGTVKSRSHRGHQRLAGLLNHLAKEQTGDGPEVQSND